MRYIFAIALSLLVCFGMNAFANPPAHNPPAHNPPAHNPPAHNPPHVPAPIEHKAPPGGHPKTAPANIKPITNNVKIVVNKNYHMNFGTKFKYGYCYKGYNHNHWSHCNWDARYGCYLYYDAGCTAWYYWCATDYYYYPITYCPHKTYVFAFVAAPVEPAICPVPPQGDPGGTPPVPPPGGTPPG